MTAVLPLIPHVLLAIVLARSLAATAFGVRSGARLRRLLSTGQRQRFRRYRRSIIESWLMAALIPAIVATSPSLTFSDVGWRRPADEIIDYLLCAYFALMVTIGGVRVRRRMRSGVAVAGRALVAAIVPQTRSERRWALSLAASAAVTEEAVYRGLLIAAGTRLYHLPLAVAVAVSLLLFIGIHAYQGLRALGAVAILSGLVLTPLYLISNSLFPVIVLHFVVNVVSMLMVPAHPTPPVEQPDSAKPATDEAQRLGAAPAESA